MCKGVVCKNILSNLCNYEIVLHTYFTFIRIVDYPSYFLSYAKKVTLYENCTKYTLVTSLFYITQMSNIFQIIYQIMIIGIPFILIAFLFIDRMSFAFKEDCLYFMINEDP